jgi:hypothetical protein
MAFRSGINQVNGSNASPIRIFNQSTPAVVSGERANLPITLGAGTYKCSLSYQVGISGTGSILMTSLLTGLSSDVTSVAISPLPASATQSIILYGVGFQTFNAGTGFTDFKETFITLSTPTTIYLYNQASYVLNAGAPVVTVSQSVTITEIKG